MCVAPLARAQQVNDASRGAARQLGYQGVESYQAGDYPTALTKLDKAYQVLQVPSLGLWSARALIKTGRWVEAAERLRQVSRLEAKGDATVQQQAQEDAKAELERLLPRIPSLLISVEGAPAAEVQLTLDGEAIASALVGEPIPANPGQHVVVGKRGAQQQSKSTSLAEGAKGELVLRFAPLPAGAAAAGAATQTKTEPPPADSDATSDQASGGGTRRLVGWVLVGAGAAGVAVGATTGFMAMGKKGDLEGSPDCREQTCLPSQRDAVDSYNSLRTISTVGLAAGAALAAAGVVLVVTAPKNDASQQASRAGLWLRISPSGGAVAGRF
jgi:hypothetical protein